MSSSDARDWKEASERLHLQKSELAREAERQQLLDELSCSTKRNHELERAMARLVREQDRLAIMEQERILKRAQVAQATAALVHEANWAKNRMQNEMQLAKQRSLLFPDTVIPGTLPQSVSLGTAADIRPLKVLKVPPEVPEPAKPSISKGSTPSHHSTPSKHSQTSTPAVLPVLPPDPIPRATAADSASLMSTFTSAYTNVVGSLFSTDGSAVPVVPTVGAVEPAAPTVSSVPTVDAVVPDRTTPTVLSVPNVGAVVPGQTAPTISPVPIVSPVPSVPAVAATPTVPPIVAVIVPAAFRLAPVAATQPALIRSVHRGGKGEWTSQEIYDEAANRMETQVGERADLLQMKRLRMAQLFGLAEVVPVSVVRVAVDPALAKLEADWIAQIQQGGEIKRAEVASVDPAIAAAMNSEPVVIDNPTPVIDSPPNSNDVQNSEGKKKKGCVIM